MSYFHFNVSDLTERQRELFWGKQNGFKLEDAPRKAEFIARVSEARRAVFSSDHYTCGNDTIRHAVAIRAALHVMTSGKVKTFTQCAEGKRLLDLDAPLFPGQGKTAWEAVALAEKEALRAAEDAYAYAQEA